MDNNKFNEESKEELEREIQELKRQKEIRELQRQKEELQKTMLDSVGGSKTTEKNENTDKKVQKDKQNEYSSYEGTNFFSNKKKIIILVAVISLVTIAAGTGIFFLNSNKFFAEISKFSTPYFFLKLFTSLSILDVNCFFLRNF